MYKEGKLNIIRPFGPAIGQTTIPEKLIEKINSFVDEVILDEKKSKELDWGQRLAGQVTQEIALPDEMLNGDLLNFFAAITRTYVENLTNRKVTKFNLMKCWVVRQFEGEYNPAHWHNGHISAAGYLKLPKDFGESKQKKNKNLNGKINFIHGSRQFLSMPIISEKPEVGKMFLFPNYIMHSVNPFYGKGERRSISFNAKVDEEIYDIYSI